MSGFASAALTRVTLVFVSERINVWLRFGHPLHERRIDIARRQVDFPSDVLLSRVHWEGNEFGTTHWSLQVLRTIGFGEVASRIPGVEPGAEVLLNVAGTNAVRRILALIDAIQMQHRDPADISPAYWRAVHNRLTARQDPPLYDERTHVAFLTRRKLQS
jgi:hypothetical protein